MQVAGDYAGMVRLHGDGLGAQVLSTGRDVARRPREPVGDGVAQVMAPEWRSGSACDRGTATTMKAPMLFKKWGEEPPGSGLRAGVGRSPACLPCH